MTTAQIIIYLILFIIDIGLTAHHINKSLNRGNPSIFGLSILRMSMTWLFLITATSRMNELRKPNPCPELEKVENVYKIK
jgi:hypothetical protein